MRLTGAVPASEALSRSIPTRSFTRCLILTILLSALCACAATNTVKESGALADAGIAYGAAAQEVIVVTRDRFIDWESDSMIAEIEDSAHCTPQEVLSNPSADCKALMDSFDEATRSDGEFVKTMDLLGAHAAALGRYFAALKAMADLDSAGQTSDAVGRLVDQVNGLSDALEGKAALSADQKSAWQKLAGLVGDSIKAAHLRKRLTEDAAVIGRAIDIQEGVLKANAAVLTGLDTADREFTRIKHVRTPYLTGTISDADGWIAARRASILPGPEVEALVKLQSASRALKDVWTGILSGTTDVGAAKQVLDDITAALDAINAVRHAK